MKDVTIRELYATNGVSIRLLMLAPGVCTQLLHEGDKHVISIPITKLRGALFNTFQSYMLNHVDPNQPYSLTNNTDQPSEFLQVIWDRK